MLPRRKSHVVAVVLVLATAGLARPDDTNKPNWSPVRTTAPETVAELKALQTTVKTIVEKVNPATVALLLINEDHAESGRPQSVGAGSGVIVSDDGLILTAAHVIDPPFGSNQLDAEGNKKASLVRVILPGRIEVKAKILGRNPRIDSGMAKIIDKVPDNATWPGAKEGKWPFVELGDSTDVKKGQWVVSLGHPGGPKRDRTAPVRVGQMVKKAENDRVIVTDCTLVGGDSGGPLFDLTGKLIGIHSRIGMSLEDNLHVPTKAFKTDWKRLLAGHTIGTRSTAVMGVRWTEVDSTKPPKVEGFPEKGTSAAEKAGVKVGDVLTHFDGERVHTIDDVDHMMSQRVPGEEVSLTLQRGDETVEVKLTLGRRERP